MRKNYWWLVARDGEGRPYLIFGSERSEDDARQKGLEMLQGLDFQIKKYPTRDRGEASAIFRGKRLEQGEGLDKARQRIGHEKSIEQLHRRRERRRTHYGN